MNKIIVIKNESEEICKPCGGQCCAWSPGIYHPTQVFDASKPVKEQIIEFLKNNDVQLVWSEAEHTTLVVSPSTKMAENKYWRNEFIGSCANYDKQRGCSLTFENRPVECQLLVPNKDKCALPAEWDRDSMIVGVWYPYEKIMEEIYDEFTIREKRGDATFLYSAVK